ncbi:helix-turn-helix transcriptional regulator [Haloechinothrix sp. YIM 98757]|uniref:Helix-turn-helix transcriptional regulator n=1 Tax=Haloechinothrix aidingensis TaxID=2752311 RepID=A0A838AFG4_9PSEU|nr:helix-turn-helix transcriptional regulator [Haloechinothrix aidingensis]
MRGAGDQMTVGERIKFYRRRRGLTQEVLANLVGRKVDWLSKIERGERDVRRLDVMSEVARALRVSVADLFGQPVLLEDENENDDVLKVRDALMTPRRLSHALFGTTAEPLNVNPQTSSHFVEQAWDAYQAGRLGRVINTLPGLIEAAQQLEDVANAGGSDARECLAVSARTHHLAATTLSKLGESDLAWIAAERAMQAADTSGDPLVLASAARAGTHALLAVGRYDDAVALGSRAAEWLAPQMANGDPSALSLYGMLHLRTAIAAARRQDRAVATDLLRRASTAADELNEDGNYWQTGFGPTNVAVHEISASLDLGDVPYVVAHGPSIVVDHLPAERRATHLVDVARAHSMIARDDVALEHLLGAEALAPQLVRHSPAVRETVKAMHRRAPVTMNFTSSPLSGLAERCRAVQ